MSVHKFVSLDAAFKARRAQFVKEHPDLDLTFVIDNWPAFAGSVGIGKVLARYEIFKSTLDIPGHIVEFGVHSGAGLHLFAKLLQLHSPNSYKKTIGFESFEGLQLFTETDKAAIQHKNRYKGSRTLLEELIEVHALGEAVELFVGDISETLPRYLAEHKSHVFSLVNVDVDLYEPTKIILDSIWPRLAVGGIVIMDEGYADTFPGEGAALQEFLAKIPGRYRCGHISFSREPMMFIRKTG